MNQSSFVQECALKAGRFFFKYRNNLFPIIFLLVFFLVPPGMVLGNPYVDFLFVVGGALMAFAGQALRLIVIGLDYIDRGGKDKKVYASRLVVGGIYSHCRNPMYVGNMLIGSGIGLLYGSPWTVIGVPAIFALISSRLIFI